MSWHGVGLGPHFGETLWHQWPTFPQLTGRAGVGADAVWALMLVAPPAMPHSCANLSCPCLALPHSALSCSRHALCGTWLWGSMSVRNNKFDPKADLYSLSFIFAEVGG